MGHQMMRDEDVGKLRDLGLIEHSLIRTLASIKDRRHKILSKHAKISEPQVTDHAIVRYLERVEGLDLTAVRDHIRAYQAASQPTGVKGVHRHPDGNQIIISNVGVIVTILPTDAPIATPYIDPNETPDD